MSKARRGAWIAIVVVVVLATAHTALWADVATPRPKWTQVQLAAETVNITLGEQRVEVDAVFELRNHGPLWTVRMGYPLGLFEKELKDFKVTVDGKPVEEIKTQKQQQGSAAGYRRARAGGTPKGIAAEPYRFQGPYKEWKVFDVRFFLKGTKTVRVRYWVEPAQITDTEKGALRLYSYTMRTGATWKGKIEKATIRVKLNGVPASRLVRVLPVGYRQSESGTPLTWTLKDFKPTDDIEIVWRPTGLASR